MRPPATEQMLDDAQRGVAGLLEGDASAENLMLIWTSVGWPIAKAILLLLVAILLARWIARLVYSATTRAKVEQTLAKFFSNLARWLVLVLAVLAILQTFGVETTSFVAVLAALGFAIGLALSGALSNVAAGVMLLIFRPFKVGDFIVTGGVSGTADEIELFTTSFDTPDKRRIVVPNSSIFGNIIENISHHKVRRVDVSVGVEYSADIAQTRKVLLEAAQSIEAVKEDPAPAVVLADLGDSSVNWVVRAWGDAADFWPTKDLLTECIKNALDEAGIGIPFPQMDVWVRRMAQTAAE